MRLWLSLVATVLLGVLIPAASAHDAKKELVIVQASGSTDLWTGKTQHFGYGVVLHNRSTTRDVLGVHLHVAVLSRTGAVIGIYLTTVPRIPAGSTFYVGNEPATIGNTQHAASIIVGVASSATQAPTGPLPSGQAHVSGTRLSGSVTNTRKTTLVTAGLRLFAIYYDRAGKVVGGTRLQHVRFPHHPRLATHRTASFTADPGAAVSLSGIANVRISVVPSYAA